MILWSARSCVTLVTVVGNSHLVTREKGVSLFLTQSITFSLFLCLYVIPFSLSHSLPWMHAHSHMIIARLWRLWFLMLYGLLNTVCLFETKASLKQHHIEALILAKTNMKIFSVWDRGEKEPQNESLWSAFLAHFNPERSEAGHRCSPSSRDNFTAG